MRSSDAGSWDRVSALLDRVLAAAPIERDSILAQLGDEQPDVIAELRSLLQAHTAAEGFLEDTPEAWLHGRDPRPYPTDGAGDAIGRYRLIESVGRGGMGTVWSAERADGAYEQRVALKLIKRGMDSDEVVARFLRERRILAGLEHANIARLLDAGVSGDGRPFLVMELVAGVPVTEYCENRALPLTAKLKLFSDICTAVQYAHDRLVVHRDIKPSNVFVDAAGSVKLLDFGIAKVLSDEAHQTETGWGRPLTPEYAAPEQLAGAQVTVASDVYQLGLLLCHMLTGQLPYTVPRADVGSVRDFVAHVEPTAPSVLGRQRALRGDLDAIVLTALRKSPSDRYRSASALSDDIQRFLSQQPVLARGPSVHYRAARFWRRHQWRLIAGALLLVTSLGVGVRYAQQIRRERDLAVREVAKARQTEDFIHRFFENWDPRAADPSIVTVASQLDRAAEAARRELASTPPLRAAMLSLLGSLNTNAGRFRVADSLLSEAVTVQRQLGRAAQADLAATLTRIGQLARATGQVGQGEAPTREALAINRSLFGEGHPEVLLVRRELWRLLGLSDRWRDAELDLRDFLASTKDKASESGFLRSEAASALGYALFQQGKLELARRVLDSTLAEQRKTYGEVHRLTLTSTRSLGSVMRDLGRLERADTLYRNALHISRSLYGEEHIETDVAWYVLGIQYVRKGDFVAAEQLAREGLERSQRLFAVPRQWEWTLLLGYVLLDQGAIPEADRVLRLALKTTREIYPEGHQNEGDILNRLALTSTLLRAPDANNLYQSGVTRYMGRDSTAADFPTDGLHYLGRAMQLNGDSSVAKTVFDRARQLYARTLPTRHPYILALPPKSEDEAR